MSLSKFILSEVKPSVGIVLSASGKITENSAGEASGEPHTEEPNGNCPHSAPQHPTNELFSILGSILNREQLHQTNAGISNSRASPYSRINNLLLTISSI
jgi:hypothetical protein